mgnify:CR=1 FL=1
MKHTGLYVIVSPIHIYTEKDGHNKKNESLFN